MKNALLASLVLTTSLLANAATTQKLIMTVTPNAYPEQAKLYDIGARATQAQLNIININRKFVNDLNSSIIGTQCEQSNVAACRKAVDVISSVFARIESSFNVINANFASAVSKVSNHSTLRDKADVDAYNSVVDMLNQEFKDEQKNMQDKNADLAAAVLGGFIIADDFKADREILDETAAERAKDEANAEHAKYASLEAGIVGRLDEVEQSVRRTQAAYARLKAQAAKLTSTK